MIMIGKLSIKISMIENCRIKEWEVEVVSSAGVNSPVYRTDEMEGRVSSALGESEKCSCWVVRH